MVEPYGKTFTDWVKENLKHIYLGKKIKNYEGEEFIVDSVEAYPDYDGYEIGFREKGGGRKSKFLFLRDSETMPKILD